MTVFKGYGFMVEYNDSKKIADNHPYCLLKHDGMSNLFHEFTGTYIPAIGSMSEKQSIEFIDELICMCK